MCRCSNEYEYCDECVDRCVPKRQEPSMAWVSATMADGQPVEAAPNTDQLKAHVDDVTFPCGESAAGKTSTFTHNWNCMMGVNKCEHAKKQEREWNIAGEEAVKKALEAIAKTSSTEKSEAVSPKEKDSFHKVPVHLFPATAIVAGAMVIAQGHKRPGRTIYNWRNEEEAIKATGYLSAVERHLLKWRDGEDFDQELSESAGVPISHIWAAFSNLAIMIDAQESGTCVDDRIKNGKVAEMMKRLTPGLTIKQE